MLMGVSFANLHLAITALVVILLITVCRVSNKLDMLSWATIMVCSVSLFITAAKSIELNFNNKQAAVALHKTLVDAIKGKHTLIIDDREYKIISVPSHDDDDDDEEDNNPEIPV